MTLSWTKCGESAGACSLVVGGVVVASPVASCLSLEPPAHEYPVGHVSPSVDVEPAGQKKPAFAEHSEQEAAPAVEEKAPTAHSEQE